MHDGGKRFVKFRGEVMRLEVEGAGPGGLQAVCEIALIPSTRIRKANLTRSSGPRQGRKPEHEDAECQTHSVQAGKFIRDLV